MGGKKRLENPMKLKYIRKVLVKAQFCQEETDSNTFYEKKDLVANHVEMNLAPAQSMPIMTQYAG